MKPTTSAVHAASLTRPQMHSAVGALIGAAAGDALGAPFEFKPAGLYLKTFPTPVLGGTGEMTGGGAFGWAKGEFTDDTQMAIALAEAILAENGEFNPARVWDHFVAWTTRATDIGNTTRRALAGSDYRTAAKKAHDSMGVSGGNGSVMRIAPIGIAGVRWGQEKTQQIAFAQSELTHFDPAAGWSAYIAAEMIRQLILDGSVEGALQHISTQVDDSFRSTFEELFVAPWHPNDWSHKSNGYSIVCLAQAVWAVRTTSSFEDAVVTAVNLGDDADTVAAVTGAIAGALYGIQNIPARWVTYLHGHVAQPGEESKTYYQYDLIALAHQLLGKNDRAKTEHETPVPPTAVHDLGVLASNALGATLASPEMGIVSLCRMEDMLHTHPHRREFYIVDKWGEGDNPDLRTVTEDAVHTIEAFLREGRQVVVHCHGGRSRTGFILKAWYMRRHQVDHQEAEQWIENVWPHYATWNDDFMEFLNNDWSI
jgi:ADP-ribosyl-[dinitrogen reductase] hydrolase